MTLTFVQGDTAPAITATIQHDADDSAVNLAGCSVKFQMRKHDDRRFTVNALATVVSAPTGAVSYAWGPNDLAVPGDYDVQWEVTFADLRIQTTAICPVTVRRQ